MHYIHLNPEITKKGVETLHYTNAGLRCILYIALVTWDAAAHLPRSDPLSHCGAGEHAHQTNLPQKSAQVRALISDRLRHEHQCKC